MAVDLDTAAKVFSESYMRLPSPAVLGGWQGDDSGIVEPSTGRIVDADAPSGGAATGAARITEPPQQYSLGVGTLL